MAETKFVRDLNAEHKKLAKLGWTRKGCLAYWWLTGAMIHRDDLKELFAQQDLSWENWGPPEQRSTVAFRKTIKEVSRNLNKKGENTGYLIRPINETDHHLVYGVVREDRLKVQEDLAHQCEAKVRLDKETCSVVCSKDNGTDGYQVAAKVRDLFDTMYCHLTVQDFSRLLTRNLKRMKAVNIRPTGAVYFVPEQYRTILNKLQAVLDAIPGDSHLSLPDVWGEQPDLAKDCKSALQGELAALKAEIEEFKTKAPRKDRLENRIEEFKDLQERGKMYAEMLGFNADQILKGLETCKKAVTAMITEGYYKGSEEQKAAKEKVVVEVEEPATVEDVEVEKVVVEVEEPVKPQSTIVQIARNASSKKKSSKKRK